jgi:hypothetical protein
MDKPQEYSASESHDEGLNELARRLGAAYVSYVAGYKGVDRMLGKTPERAGTFWRDLAGLVFTAMSRSEGTDVGGDLTLRDVITKYIQ